MNEKEKFVYIVYESGWDCYYIYGIFEEEENAKNFAKEKFIEETDWNPEEYKKRFKCEGRFSVKKYQLNIDLDKSELREEKNEL